MTSSAADGDPAGEGGGGAPSLRGEHYESFVVRLLIGSDGDVVHGHVTHVASGRGLHFTDTEHLPILIRRQLATGCGTRLVPRKPL